MEWIQEPAMISATEENEVTISPAFTCGKGYSGGFSPCPTQNGCLAKVCTSQGCTKYNCIILIG